MPLRMAVLVSGGGTNLQAVIDASREGKIQAEVVLVASNRQNAYGLVRAKNAGIKALVLPKEERYEYLQSLLEIERIDLVVLAGYLEILPAFFVKKFERRIINIHPSLLPKYGGKDFYGTRVHRAVLEAKEERTGATVHFVDVGVDTGQVIGQQSVEVAEAVTVEALQEKVLAIEHKLLIDVIGDIANQRIPIGGSK